MCAIAAKFRQRETTTFRIWWWCKRQMTSNSNSNSPNLKIEEHFKTSPIPFRRMCLTFSKWISLWASHIIHRKWYSNKNNRGIGAIKSHKIKVSSHRNMIIANRDSPMFFFWPQLSINKPNRRVIRRVWILMYHLINYHRYRRFYERSSRMNKSCSIRRKNRVLICFLIMYSCLSKAIFILHQPSSFLTIARKYGKWLWIVKRRYRNLP